MMSCCSIYGEKFSFDRVLPTDPEHKKGLNPYACTSCEFKKCCKKYKKGKRCGKCPKR